VSRAEAAIPGQTVHHNKPSCPDRSSTAWSIQVGAFANYDAAQGAGAAALAKLPAAKDKIALVVPPAHSDKQPFYRARIAGFTETEAQKACRTLHSVMSSKQKLCAVIPPQPASQTVLQFGPPAPAPAPVQPAAQPAPAPESDAPGTSEDD
jgi:hypothetical protein